MRLVLSVSHFVLDMPSSQPEAHPFLFADCLEAFWACSFQVSSTLPKWYILIPLLVIPQIILGGAIIRFDRFNPALMQPDGVPWFGNIIASRWGFEALAVELSRNNPYDGSFNDLKTESIGGMAKRLLVEREEAV